MNATYEAEIWPRLLRAQKGELSAGAADFLLAVDFAECDRNRMPELAERSEAGILTPEEQTKFDSYRRVGNFLAIVHSKARLALNKTTRRHRRDGETSSCLPAL